MKAIEFLKFNTDANPSYEPSNTIQDLTQDFNLNVNTGIVPEFMYQRPSSITSVDKSELNTSPKVVPKESVQEEIIKEDNPVSALKKENIPSVKLNKQEFRNKFINDATRVASVLKVDPNVILAQAYLESGGNPNKSMFGIKAGKNYKGTKATFRTKEQVGDNMVSINDDFRTYATHSDAFDDYGRLISNNRYKHAIGLNPKEYYQAIHSAGYATDKGYVGKLMNVFDDFSKLQ